MSQKRLDSIRTLAGQCGLSKSSVAQMRKDGLTDDQIRSRGRQTTPAQKAKETRAFTPEEYEQDLRRKMRADADKVELENQLRRKELIPVADVEAKLSEWAAGIRDAVLSIPSQLASRVPSEWRREVVAIVTEEARRALDQASVSITA